MQLITVVPNAVWILRANWVILNNTVELIERKWLFIVVVHSRREGWSMSCNVVSMVATFHLQRLQTWQLKIGTRFFFYAVLNNLNSIGCNNLDVVWVLQVHFEVQTCLDWSSAIQEGVSFGSHCSLKEVWKSEHSLSITNRMLWGFCSRAIGQST